jgi:hypothetical protein
MIPILLEFVGKLDSYFISNQKDVHKLLQICKKWREYLIPYIIPKLQFCTMCNIHANVLPFVRHLIDVTYLSTPVWFHVIAPQIKTLTLTYPKENMDGFINLEKIVVSKSIHHTCFPWGYKIKTHILFTLLPRKLKSIRFQSQDLQFPDCMFINLPSSLEILSLPCSFNSPLTNLPVSLKSLKIGKDFNQTLIIPPRLKFLQLGEKFNQPIKLVSSLRSIIFGSHFNQPIENLNGVRYLSLPKNYTHKVDLPISLSSMSFMTGHISPDFTQIPNMKRLYLGKTFNHTWKLLPQKLQKLDIYDFTFNLPLGCLPNCLQLLKLNSVYFNYPMGMLPDSLQILKLGDGFNHCLGTLPNSLEYLEMGNSFNHPLGVLPNSLEYLEMGYSFNHPLGVLPNSLEYLEIGNSFNHCLGVLPDSLRKLQLGTRFEHQILNVPNRMEKLSVMPLFISQMEVLLPHCPYLKIYSCGKLISRSYVVTRSMSKRQKL